MKRDLTALKAIIKADYNRHIKRFSSLKSHKDAVLIGDSMVAYFPLKTYGLDEYIHNLGIPGDTTLGVYNRIHQVLDLQPKHVILHIGLNDEVLLEQQVDDTIAQIKNIIHRMKAALKTVTITIIGLTPINQSNFSHSTYVIDRNPEFSLKVNAGLKKIKGISYIDLYTQLINFKGELDARFTTDGIHLNKQGYAIYKNLIENIL